MVPDVGVVVDYLEILEFRELQGIVFTQTSCQAVQQSKGRRYAHTSTPGWSTACAEEWFFLLHLHQHLQTDFLTSEFLKTRFSGTSKGLVVNSFSHLI